MSKSEWMEKEDAELLRELNKRRNKQISKQSWKKNISIEKAMKKLGLRSKIKRAIQDRHIGERGGIPLLDGKPLRYWEDLAKNGDKNAEARVNAYKIQEQLRAEAIWEDNEESPAPREKKYPERRRTDLLQ